MRILDGLSFCSLMCFSSWSSSQSHFLHPGWYFFLFSLYILKSKTSQVCSNGVNYLELRMAFAV